MCLERGAITPDMVWNQLYSAHCFSKIGRDKFDQFFNFLLDRDFLHDDGRVFSMGLKAEKAFGRKNFMEIYSVFSSPLEFEVVGLSGDIIGTVQWDFLEKLLEESSAFYLAGSAWFVKRIEWKKKCVKVTPAPSGKVPKWSSITPGFLGYELCRKMRDVLVSDEAYSYLDLKSGQSLTSMREDRQALLASSFAPVEHDDKGFIWWTWAGGNINNTLRAVLRIELNADVQAGNEYIRVNSDTSMFKTYTDTISKISQPHYWDNPEFLKKLYEMVPNYRLSKFQPYLPETLKLRLVAETLFDIEGTLAFLKSC